MPRQLVGDDRLVAEEDEAQSRVGAVRANRARNGGFGARVAAHGVDRDCRGPGHRPALTSGFGRGDFAAVVMTASRAQIVRQLELPAVGAFLERRWLQRMMAAAHVALRGRRFSLGDSHCGTFSWIDSIKMATPRASSQRNKPAGGSRIVAKCGPYSEMPSERKSGAD